LIVGINSSGKSSLIQSILLLAQAAQSRQIGDVLPLNGELVNLGSFNDVLSGSSRGQIGLGATLTRRDPVPRIGYQGAYAYSIGAVSPEDRQILWDIRLKGMEKSGQSNAGFATIARAKLRLGSSAATELIGIRR